MRRPTGSRYSAPTAPTSCPPTSSSCPLPRGLPEQLSRPGDRRRGAHLCRGLHGAGLGAHLAAALRTAACARRRPRPPPSPGHRDPHSGKEEPFRRLLGLLDARLATVGFESRVGRELLAQFSCSAAAPTSARTSRTARTSSSRDTAEVSYTLHRDYRALLAEVLAYARETVRSADGRCSSGSAGGRRWRCCAPCLPRPPPLCGR
ncbi:hypothetical protein NKH77_19010 [Streptomyces sp. M19]